MTKIMQFNTKAPKITKRWIINHVSMTFNKLRSDGIEQTKAIMFKKDISVV